MAESCLFKIYIVELAGNHSTHDRARASIVHVLFYFVQCVDITYTTHKALPYAIVTTAL
jgi:hypothetical protein